MNSVFKFILVFCFLSQAYAANYNYIFISCEQDNALFIRLNLSKPIAEYNNQGISGFVLPSGVNIQSMPYPNCTDALAAVPSAFKKIQIPEKSGNGLQYLFQQN